MPNTMISVEGLGKKYRIGQKKMAPYSTLRETLEYPLKNLKFNVQNGFKRKKNSSDTTKSPQEFWALKDVSFEIQQGDTVGIMGRNGAGKSTLLKILSRITEPTNGRVELRGRVASLLEIGTGFHPELTGRENIYLNGSILGMRRAEIKTKFEEIVDFSGVEKFLDTPVKHFSSGMYVRLAFAVAAHLEPEILIVDEILAVGDAEFQKKCLGKMNEVSQKDGRTVLFVSHNLASLRALCKKGIFLNEGKLMSIDTIEKTVQHYLSLSADVTEKTGTVYDDETLIVHAIQIITTDGSPLSIEKTILVRFEITWKKNIRGVAYELFFYTAEGTPVFSSFTNAFETHRGTQTVECTIPANTFNDLNYTFDVGISKDFSFFLVKLNSVLTFKVENYIEGFGWHGEYPGVLRPKLIWKII